ncbi:MAG: hypothetical protein ACJ71K_12600 [Nitrososphaeraceae archaeon]
MSFQCGGNKRICYRKGSESCFNPIYNTGTSGSGGSSGSSNNDNNPSSSDTNSPLDKNG